MQHQQWPPCAEWATFFFTGFLPGAQAKFWEKLALEDVDSGKYPLVIRWASIPVPVPVFVVADVVAFGEKLETSSGHQVFDL